MQTTTTQFKHCSLVKVQGRVDSATAPQLAESLKTIMDNGHYKIVLDYSQLEFISSAGLRVMINTQKACKRYNRGEVVLAALPNNIHAALDLAGFTSIFEIFDDALIAVGSF